MADDTLQVPPLIDYTAGLDTMDSVLAARNAKAAAAAANALRDQLPAYDPVTCRPSDKTIARGESEKAMWTGVGNVIGAVILNAPALGYYVTPDSTADGVKACLKAKDNRK